MSTPTRAEVEHFVKTMDIDTHRMFDPEFDPLTGKGKFDHPQLCERVEAYLKTRSEFDLAEHGKAREVVYNFEGDQAAAQRRAGALTDTSFEGEREARQRLRRSKAVQDLIAGLANRAEPSGGVCYVTIAQHQELMDEYREAKASGCKDDEVEWLPLSAYHHKILPEGRAPVRQLLANECGILLVDGRICCIRDRDLGVGDRGTLVSVPRVEPSPDLLPGPKED